MVNNFASPIINTTSPADLMIAIQNATGGWLGWGLIVCVFVISMFSMKNYSTAKAVAASSFITSIISLFLLGIGIIDQYTVYIIIAILAPATIFSLHAESSARY
jgi:hypothetical protein